MGVGFFSKKVVVPNEKILLSSNKHVLFLESSNINQIANMYTESAYDFFKMLPDFLNLKGISGSDFNITKKGYEDHQLTVKISKYEELRELIFRFAFIACSDIGASESKYVIHSLPLLEILKESIKLMEVWHFHAIIPTRFDQYCIMASYKRASSDELDEKYKLIRQ